LKISYEKAVQRGENPGIDLESILEPYALSPTNPTSAAPASSSAPSKNPPQHRAFPPKDG